MLNNTSHAGKETENKYVFKREQKTGRVVADVTSVGRLFHKRLSVTGKTRSPTVTSLVDGMTRALDIEERSGRRADSVLRHVADRRTDTAVVFHELCRTECVVCQLVTQRLWTAVAAAVSGGGSDNYNGPDVWHESGTRTLEEQLAYYEWHISNISVIRCTIIVCTCSLSTTCIEYSVSQK